MADVERLTSERQRKRQLDDRIKCVCCLFVCRDQLQTAIRGRLLLAA